MSSMNNCDVLKVDAQEMADIPPGSHREVLSQCYIQPFEMFAEQVGWEWVPAETVEHFERHGIAYSVHQEATIRGERIAFEDLRPDMWVVETLRDEPRLDSYLCIHNPTPDILFWYKMCCYDGSQA